MCRYGKTDPLRLAVVGLECIDFSPFGMQLGLGDKLTFNIGSEIVELNVTSIRNVNWQSMQPNFFFVIEPRALKSFIPTYISSFNLPTERKSEITQLMQPFANVTLIDVDARINQLRNIVDQVSMAVEFILILVLAAGALVLIAQVQASMDERQQELAILRTLGAKGRLIRASVVFEFIIIGVVAGAMAAAVDRGGSDGGSGDSAAQAAPTLAQAVHQWRHAS